MLKVKKKPRLDAALDNFKCRQKIIDNRFNQTHSRAMKNDEGLVTSLQSGLRRALEELAGAGQGLEAALHGHMLGFYELMSQDLMIGFFFANKDLDHVALQQTRFLLRAAGIKNEYTGKAPSRAHDELPPILRGHFHRRLVLLREFLTAQGLSTVSVDAWVAFEAAFEDMIVKS